MRLKTLEIKGFKSFADRTLINFDEDVTGIVGPNGCGKSNVVDAIRWVLGEQRSRLLRSGKMENVIFNGSKNRKSSNLAEVSITFENTKNILPIEYKDVTITRRLFRNEESEYRINNTLCRLKDITALLMDTGIGSDSYAIIELNMIDQILEDKDGARSRLFEQAAGIVKYKKRKQETLNKLSNTEDNLIRINDLLYEIDANLKSLEQQARKADRYNKIKEKYKELSIQLVSVKLKSYNKSFSDLAVQEKAEGDHKVSIITKIESIEAEVAKLKNDSIEKEQQLSASQKEYNKMESEINELQNRKQLDEQQRRLSEEKINTLEAKSTNATNSVGELRARLNHLNEMEQSAQSNLKQKQQESDQLKEKLSETRTKHETLKSKVDSNQKLIQDLVDQIHKTESNLTINKTRIQTLEQTNLSGNSNVDDANTLKTNQEALQLVNEQIRVQEDKVNQLKSEEDQLNDKIGSVEAKIEMTTTEFQEIQRKLDATRHEYDLTKSMVENLEGFPESIKFLKKNSPTIKEAPLLSDIIVTEDKYKAAIENFLEPYLNYYIVSNFGEAIQAVQLLKESSKGRANFFIMDEFVNYQTVSSQDIEHCTPALNVVTTDEKHTRLISFLLDKVYLVEEEKISFKELLNNKDALHKGKFFITQSGQFSRTAYALSGGSVGLFTGKKLGRAKNLEVLKEQVDLLSNQNDKLSSQLNSLKTEQAGLNTLLASDNLENERAKLDSLNNQQVSLAAKVEHVQNYWQDLEEQKKQIKTQIESLLKENKELEPMFEEVQLEKSKLDHELSEAQEKFNTINYALNKETEEFNAVNTLFHQEQNKYNDITREISYNNSEIGSLEEELNTNKEENELTQKLIQELTISLGQNEKSLFGSYEKKEKLEEALNKDEAAYYQTKGTIKELEDKIRELRQNKDASEELLDGIKEKITDLKIELNSLKERLRVEFNVDLNSMIEQGLKEAESADAHSDEVINDEELTEKVDNLKHRIDNYGEINSMAIEAYDEIKERSDFITTQKQDLLDAKDSLMETIQEIDDKAKEKFVETFELARGHFIDVFRSLFTEEDDCDLILKDPDNPLDSAIDIIAKPKGKKPLSINQLSGGEKALTAIALLFGLYLLKPAPFCIFDEVDAPLDDLNIEKFNNIIRKFSNESQFTIITHNKTTISAVDLIYGVTMTEEGVSRIVPVDFRKIKEVETDPQTESTEQVA